jgi:hypothetical protein
MAKLRILLLTSCFALAAFGQEIGRSTVTIGAGGGFATGGYFTDGIPNAPAFSASYEFRVFRFLAPEVSVVNMIPNVPEGSEFGTSILRERVTLVSPVLRGILPLRHDSVELFAGVGAARLTSSYYELTENFEPSWFLEIDGGFRAALGHRHRFWIGPTVRFYRDFNRRPTEQWLSLTGEFGFRF